MLSYSYLMLCFMLPNIFWQFFNRKRLLGQENHVRHIIWTVIFWVYCSLTIYLAGVGTIWDIVFYKELIGGINLIPFSSNNAATYILKIIILMPFGFLLPFIWKEYRNFRKVCLLGFGFSLLMEIFQLFNRSVSDVDDLLMNTIGTCAGYLVWILYSSLLFEKGKGAKQNKPVDCFGKREPVIYVLLGIIGVFILFNWRPLDNQISSSANMAVIVCNDGSVEELTYRELLYQYHENPGLFETKYKGAKISLTDTLAGNGVNSVDDEGGKNCALTFTEGWRLEFAFEEYGFIDKSDEEGRIVKLLVESFIAGVWEYEEGKFQIVLGSWDENLAGKTKIIEVE